MEPNRLEQLILNGTIEVAGMTDNGEFTYRFTKKLEENEPELHKEFLDFVYKQVTLFWEKGFLDMDMSEEDPKVCLTSKALDPKEFESLSEMEKINLGLIISTMFEQDK